MAGAPVGEITRTQLGRIAEGKAFLGSTKYPELAANTELCDYLRSRLISWAEANGNKEILELKLEGDKGKQFDDNLKKALRIFGNDDRLGFRFLARLEAGAGGDSNLSITAARTALSRGEVFYSNSSQPAQYMRGLEQSEGRLNTWADKNRSWLQKWAVNHGIDLPAGKLLNETNGKADPYFSVLSEAFQDFHNERNQAKLVVDGKFGKLTDAAMNDYLASLQRPQPPAPPAEPAPSSTTPVERKAPPKPAPLPPADPLKRGAVHSEEAQRFLVSIAPAVKSNNHFAVEAQRRLESGEKLHPNEFKRYAAAIKNYELCKPILTAVDSSRNPAVRRLWDKAASAELITPQYLAEKFKPEASAYAKFDAIIQEWKKLPEYKTPPAPRVGHLASYFEGWNDPQRFSFTFEQREVKMADGTKAMVDVLGAKRLDRPNDPIVYFMDDPALKERCGLTAGGCAISTNSKDKIYQAFSSIVLPLNLMETSSKLPSVLKGSTNTAATVSTASSSPEYALRSFYHEMSHSEGKHEAGARIDSGIKRGDIMRAVTHEAYGLKEYFLALIEFTGGRVYENGAPSKTLFDNVPGARHYAENFKIGLEQAQQRVKDKKSDRQSYAKIVDDWKKERQSVTGRTSDLKQFKDAAAYYFEEKCAREYSAAHNGVISDAEKSSAPWKAEAARLTAQYLADFRRAEDSLHRRRV